MNRNVKLIDLFIKQLKGCTGRYSYRYDLIEKFVALTELRFRFATSEYIIHHEITIRIWYGISVAF